MKIQDFKKYQLVLNNLKRNIINKNKNKQKRQENFEKKKILLS